MTICPDRGSGQKQAYPDNNNNITATGTRVLISRIAAMKITICNNNTTYTTFYQSTYNLFFLKEEAKS